MRDGPYVIRDNKLVLKSEASPRIRSVDPRMYVISDVMDPLRHMATGRMHDSKSKFRADTRAAGCIEVGTDPAATRDVGIQGRYRDGWANQSSVAQDVKRALQELRSR